MENKVCTKCGVEKPKSVEYFRFVKSRNNFRSACIVCSNKINKEYRLKNADKEKERWKKYYEENREQQIERVNEYNKKNEESVKIRRRNYSKKNRERERVREKKAYQKHRSKKLEKSKEYHSRPEVKKRKNERDKLRRKTDESFKFNCMIMKHIRGVKNRDTFKQEWNDVMGVYEMYGIDYHIDHKIPKNWFKTTTNKTIVNDLRNLQVIDSVYNLKKQDRWCDDVPQEYLNTIIPFLKEKYVKIVQNERRKNG